MASSAPYLDASALAVDADDDDDDDDVEEVSTDGRGVTDVSEVAGQLAGATSAIADQLSMITEEMNKLTCLEICDCSSGAVGATGLPPKATSSTTPSRAEGRRHRTPTHPPATAAGPI